ncbi:MAG: transposase family protein [Gammaproteobacteria bacterium]|nr:transposase family protein [Gammaproteobacteria bacterium]
MHQEQLEAGLKPHARHTPSNCKSRFESKEDESLARNDAVTGLIQLMHRQLPVLLRRLGKIPDPRNPNKLKYKLTVLMIYGILVFVFQYGSRRAANREITRPVFEDNLRMLFPELETLPHADTLFRLLCRIDVSQIEQIHVELVDRLIRGKKFSRYLVNNCYPVAIDGSQKIAFSLLRDEHLLQRKSKRKIDIEAGEEPDYQYYVYVLEASLSFCNGMVIPLMSQFLEYQTGDGEQSKQDCEQKAFHRLAARIKKAFPRLPIILLLDGLYPNGPMMDRCRTYHWDFMIVLKDKSLPSVWEEYHGLKGHQKSNQKHQNWGDRRQHFQWVNQIRYEFGANGKKFININVVVCNEVWEEVDPKTAEIVPKKMKYAWISSRPISQLNVHTRCNLGARYRWGIEAGFLVEKHQGYSYEHAFAKNWNAMKGYHYLMRLAHLFNTLARFSKELAGLFAELGVRAAIGFIRNTLTGPWLDPREVEQRLNRPFRLRLV